MRGGIARRGPKEQTITVTFHNDDIIAGHHFIDTLRRSGVTVKDVQNIGAYAGDGETIIVTFYADMYAMMRGYERPSEHAVPQSARRIEPPSEPRADPGILPAGHYRYIGRPAEDRPSPPSSGRALLPPPKK